MFKKRKKIVLRSDSAVLFVCYGNHARSPMAEGLARIILGEGIRVESAGIHPLFDGAAEEAVQVLKDVYDADISSHLPRHINSLNLDDFDCVIVLDSAVHDFLKRVLLIPDSKLFLWHTDDPYSFGYDTYALTAARLKIMIEENFDTSRLTQET